MRMGCVYGKLSNDSNELTSASYSQKVQLLLPIIHFFLYVVKILCPLRAELRTTGNKKQFRKVEKGKRLDNQTKTTEQLCGSL